MDGLVISNTSIARSDDLEEYLAKEACGLSGAPIAKASTSMIATMYQLTKGILTCILYNLFTRSKNSAEL